MKKLVFLLVVVLLSSCKCLIGQIPPQYLYVDENCGAAMPDYIPKFTYTDNCGIDTVWQSPTKGTWLTQPVNNAMIRAIDRFGNYTDILFTVNLIDTIPPTITLNDSTLLTNGINVMTNLYNMADRILAREELFFDSVFPWDSIPAHEAADSYANKVMLTWTSPRFAFTGEGGRVHTFVNPGDTLIIPLNYYDR